MPRVAVKAFSYTFIVWVEIKKTMINKHHMMHYQEKSLNYNNRGPVVDVWVSLYKICLLYMEFCWLQKTAAHYFLKLRGETRRDKYSNSKPSTFCDYVAFPDKSRQFSKTLCFLASIIWQHFRNSEFYNADDNISSQMSGIMMNWFFNFSRHSLSLLPKCQIQRLLITKLCEACDYYFLQQS